MECLDKYQHETLEYQPLKSKGKRSRSITNTVIDEMQGRNPSDPFCGVSDIIAGVCRLDHYGQKQRNTPLSQNRVYNILKCMPEIYTEEIQNMTKLSQRQSQRYLKAIKIILVKLEEHFDEHGDHLAVDDDFLTMSCDVY